jgi:hypothetical protein
MMELFKEILLWSIYVAMFGVPFAVAWWASDGFTSDEIGSMETEITIALDPFTQKPGLALVCRNTGHVIYYMG